MSQSIALHWFVGNGEVELGSCRCHIACPVLASQRRRSESVRIG
jgi:hypothetical protein